MRCFIGAELPPDIKSKLWKLGRNIKGKHVEIENLHITIKFLGELKDDNSISNIISRLSFIDNYNSIKIKLNGAGIFPSKIKPRVVWIGVISKEFIDFMKNIDDALYPNFKRERSYIPHITIARVKALSDDNIKELGSIGFIDEVEIKKVSIFKSTLLPTGPVYSRIKTWVLK